MGSKYNKIINQIKQIITVWNTIIVINMHLVTFSAPISINCIVSAFRKAHYFKNSYSEIIQGFLLEGIINIR